MLLTKRQQQQIVAIKVNYSAWKITTARTLFCFYFYIYFDLFFFLYLNSIFFDFLLISRQKVWHAFSACTEMLEENYGKVNKGARLKNNFHSMHLEKRVNTFAEVNKTCLSRFKKQLKMYFKKIATFYKNFPIFCESTQYFYLNCT